jgi:DNA-binding MarR family transcriptional regulator
VSASNDKVSVSLREALRVQQTLFAALKGGPKTTAMEVLALLYFSIHPDVTQVEAAESLGVTQAAVSAWLLKWQDLGFLELIPDPQRLNRKEVNWTAEGRRLFTTVRDMMR